ncbi:MAG: hypothetical protein ACJ8HF_24505, partial [Pseudomonas sp.]
MEHVVDDVKRWTAHKSSLIDPIRMDTEAFGKFHRISRRSRPGLAEGASALQNIRAYGAEPNPGNLLQGELENTGARDQRRRNVALNKGKT